MNSLSWLIYLIDVVDNAKGFAVGILVLTAMGCGGYLLFGFIEQDRMNVPQTRWIAIAGLCIALIIFVPAKQTMYAMAASEAGERIAMNPTAQDMSKDALKAVRLWIKSQIKEDK